MSERYEPGAVTTRLRRQAELADLASRGRLLHKIDMSASAVTQRLRRQAALLRACRQWGFVTRTRSDRTPGT